MSLGALGAFALVLVVVFLFGQLWFHLVEAILSRIKRLFSRRRKPPAWHPLPPEEDQDP
jgi:hypothetical protein